MYQDSLNESKIKLSCFFLNNYDLVVCLVKCTGIPISTFEDKQIFAGDTAVVVSVLFAIQLFTSPLFESDLTLYSLGFLANFLKENVSFQMTTCLLVIHRSKYLGSWNEHQAEFL